jgi:2-dehydropantoate 2-reductase
MKVLIVGCGAVGQVFGLSLMKAGVELGFYARPGPDDRLIQALEIGRGMPLFQISHFHRRDPIAHQLENYQVVTDIVGSQRFNPDQIWFTTPSSVYYSEWFQKFLQEVPSKMVVCFAPEGGRPEFISEGEGQDRFVFGGITFMAWQGDLEGGGGQPEAVNFWKPPLIEIPLVGADRAANEVAELLKAGGFRSSVKKETFHKMQAALTAFLSAFVAGLELSSWSLRAFRRSPWLKRAAHASRDAALSQLSNSGIFAKVLFKILTSSAILFAATYLLPLIFPFDLEKYLKFHYLKTRDQTLDLLELFIKDGEAQGLPVENIQILLDSLLQS